MRPEPTPTGRILAGRKALLARPAGPDPAPMKHRGFERILLATDGSDQADAATHGAAALAEPSNASVRVVHCWNLEVHHRHGVWDVEMRSEAEKLIGEAVRRLRALDVEADGRL